jgi:hypothetical protein
MNELSNQFMNLSEQYEDGHLKTLLQGLSIIVSCEEAVADAVEALEPIVISLVLAAQAVLVSHGVASSSEFKELIFKVLPANEAILATEIFEESHPGIFEKEN